MALLVRNGIATRSVRLVNERTIIKYEACAKRQPSAFDPFNRKPTCESVQENLFDAYWSNMLTTCRPNCTMKNEKRTRSTLRCFRIQCVIRTRCSRPLADELLSAASSRGKLSATHAAVNKIPNSIQTDATRYGIQGLIFISGALTETEMNSAIKNVA